MVNELIVIKQLPVIEDQLREVKATIQAHVDEALSLACTEETYKIVKSTRAALNKEYVALESRRKQVKAEILAPYERFEATYKECVGDLYVDADKKLKQRIAEIEGSLRQQKEDKVSSYYAEYLKSLGLDPAIAPFSRSGIKTTLSESEKSLKARAKAFLDGVESDLRLIATLENKDEILVEYRRTLDVSDAVTTVSDRHKAMERERLRREEAEAVRAEKEAAAALVSEVIGEESFDQIQIPTAVPDPEAPKDAAPESGEPIYEVRFSVKGTKQKLRSLKDFLENGGYEYADI